MDQNMTGLRVVLEQVEQHESVDVSQAEIERDRRRLKLASHVQSARSRGRHDSLELCLVRGVEQDGRKRRVVLDDQYERIFAELVAVIADLEAGRQCGRDDR